MPHVEIPLDDLIEDRPLRVEHEGEGIVVVRHDGVVHAWEDVCPHAGWRLSDGEVTGGRLECPGHAWQFDLATGRCLEVPFYCLRRLAVQAEDGVVRVIWSPPGETSDGPAAD